MALPLALQQLQKVSPDSSATNVQPLQSAMPLSVQQAQQVAPSGPPNALTFVQPQNMPSADALTPEQQAAIQQSPLWSSLKTGVKSDVGIAAEMAGGALNLGPDVLGGGMGLLKKGIDLQQQAEKEAEEEKAATHGVKYLAGLALRNPLTTVGLATALGAPIAAGGGVAAVTGGIGSSLWGLGKALAIGGAASTALTMGSKHLAPVTYNSDGTIVPTDENYNHQFYSDLAGAVGGIVGGSFGLKKTPLADSVTPEMVQNVQNNPLSAVSEFGSKLGLDLSKYNLNSKSGVAEANNAIIQHVKNSTDPNVVNAANEFFQSSPMSAAINAMTSTTQETAPNALTSDKILDWAGNYFYKSLPDFDKSNFQIFNNVNNMTDLNDPALRAEFTNALGSALRHDNGLTSLNQWAEKANIPLDDKMNFALASLASENPFPIGMDIQVANVKNSQAANDFINNNTPGGIATRGVSQAVQNIVDNQSTPGVLGDKVASNLSTIAQVIKNTGGDLFQRADDINTERLGSPIVEVPTGEQTTLKGFATANSLDIPGGENVSLNSSLWDREKVNAPENEIASQSIDQAKDIARNLFTGLSQMTFDPQNATTAHLNSLKKLTAGYLNQFHDGLFDTNEPSDVLKTAFKVPGMGVLDPNSKSIMSPSMFYDMAQNYIQGARRVAETSRVDIPQFYRATGGLLDPLADIKSASDNVRGMFLTSAQRETMKNVYSLGKNMDNNISDAFGEAHPINDYERLTQPANWADKVQGLLSNSPEKFKLLHDAIGDSFDKFQELVKGPLSDAWDKDSGKISHIYSKQAEKGGMSRYEFEKTNPKELSEFPQMDRDSFNKQLNDWKHSSDSALNQTITTKIKDLGGIANPQLRDWLTAAAKSKGTETYTDLGGQRDLLDTFFHHDTQGIPVANKNAGVYEKIMGNYQNAETYVPRLQKYLSSHPDLQSDVVQTANLKTNEGVLNALKTVKSDPEGTKLKIASLLQQHQAMFGGMDDGAFVKSLGSSIIPALVSKEPAVLSTLKSAQSYHDYQSAFSNLIDDFTRANEKPEAGIVPMTRDKAIKMTTDMLSKGWETQGQKEVMVNGKNVATALDHVAKRHQEYLNDLAQIAIQRLGNPRNVADVGILHKMADSISTAAGIMTTGKTHHAIRGANALIRNSAMQSLADSQASAADKVAMLAARLQNKDFLNQTIQQMMAAASPAKVRRKNTQRMLTNTMLALLGGQGISSVFSK